MQALRPSGHSAVTALTFSRGISATAFTSVLFRLSRLLWCFWQAMSSKTADSLQSRGLRSGLPEGQFSALIKGKSFLRSHSWVVLASWTGAESCWNTLCWPLNGVMLRGFTTPCSTSSWYTRAPVPPLSRKNEEVSPPDGTPPPYHDTGRVMAFLHPRNAPQEHLSINLLVLVVVLLLYGEDFLACEEDVFVPGLGVPLEETLCSRQSNPLQNRSKGMYLWGAVRCHV